jgi:acetyl-CoA decarbonylase/synthase complex subunit beta
MANQTGGGKQMPGFNGISLQYIASPKYQQYDGINDGLDGGVQTIVWMNKGLKDRVQEFLPEDLVDKIATDEDTNDINELREWLIEKEHPIIETDAFKAGGEEEEEEEGEWEEGGEMVPMGTQTMTIPGAGGMGGFKIILKNCKVHAESLIIKRIGSKKKKK